MGRKCIVPSCTSGYDSNKEKVSIFKIPAHRLEEWSQAIPRTDRQLTTRDHVCAKHFNDHEIITVEVTELYTKTLSKPKIAEGAVPSKFPGCPKRVEVPQKQAETYKFGTAEDKLNNGELNIKVENNLFHEICEGNTMLHLPATSWATHFHSTLDQEDSYTHISVSEITIDEEKSILRKNILITPEYIRFCAYGKLIDDPNLPMDITSIGELEAALRYFHELQI